MNRGSVLLEVLVAFFLLAVVAAGLLRSFGEASRVLRASRLRLEAFRIAETAVENLALGRPAPTPRAGFRVEAAVRPVPGGRPLDEIEVRVSWDAASAPGAFSLRTWRLR
ncbi:MAG: hypothetical protein KatS3mg076_1151 [Candidatus Binatia bacterium]|nr:MAG: hypothetical protein KatS3mg076_1151 [Candidatus Binatia bacterium]